MKAGQRSPMEDFKLRAPIMCCLVFTQTPARGYRPGSRDADQEDWRTKTVGPKLNLDITAMVPRYRRGMQVISRLESVMLGKVTHPGNVTSISGVQPPGEVMSAGGTERTCSVSDPMSPQWGKADSIRDMQPLLTLTQSGRHVSFPSMLPAPSQKKVAGLHAGRVHRDEEVGAAIAVDVTYDHAVCAGKAGEPKLTSDT
jgi:hypothetical protein